MYKFRDLVIGKAGDELALLRDVLAGLVAASSALAVGEDFLLLSSAEFGEDKIEVTKRVGLDLILPVAAILPFERLVGWGDAKKLPPKMLEDLLGGAVALAPLLIGALNKKKLPGAIGLVLGLIFSGISEDTLREAAKLVGEKLEEVNSDALVKHDNLTATLTGFKMDLEKGEQQDILLRSHL
ncbi:hypothetical protein SDC9_84860 [bioreactor metagenome]|uniref:Uncharacterized protein n=1 Tax=bioreactor metagenome TaxID=1076179 RepID=A0A644ZEB1_9ZZZZ